MILIAELIPLYGTAYALCDFVSMFCTSSKQYHDKLFSTIACKQIDFTNFPVPYQVGKLFEDKISCVMAIFIIYFFKVVYIKNNCNYSADSVC
jgi:hypothetical protein